MDYTYKTNRFPLLSIVGSYSLNQSFYVAFAFLSGEMKRDYRWAMGSFRNVTIQAEEVAVPVIVTDREPALINAIKLVFPEAKHMPCEWHSNTIFLLTGEKRRL